MSPVLDIKVALSSLFSDLSYQGYTVPVYDTPRDDAESPYVYIANMEEDTLNSKSANQYWILLQLGVSIIFDATQGSMRVADEIGALVTNRLESGNLNLGANYTTVVQYFSGSRYAKGKNSRFEEQLKIIDYRLFIHEKN